MAWIILIIFLSLLPIFVIMSTLFLAAHHCHLLFPLWDPILLMETGGPISMAEFSASYIRPAGDIFQSARCILKIKYILIFKFGSNFKLIAMVQK